jgi:hypothetical protein
LPISNNCGLFFVPLQRTWEQHIRLAVREALQRNAMECSLFAMGDCGDGKLGIQSTTSKTIPSPVTELCYPNTKRQIKFDQVCISRLDHLFF